MQNHPIHTLPVDLVAYDPHWPQMFEEEAARFRQFFGDNLVDIHHIGSTAVPGLVAKPLIDMMPVVKNLGCVDDINAPLEALGYIPMGELGIPGRRFFCKSLEKRTHNVHVFQEGDPNIARHLKFRDTLRERPDLAQTYGNLKLELVKQHRLDRKAYTDAKTEFVKSVEKL